MAHAATSGDHEAGGGRLRGFGRRAAAVGAGLVVVASFTVSSPAAGETPTASDTASQGRIVGGTTASAGEYPYQVAVNYDVGFGQSQYCGGSLIHPRYVMTAAHCVRYYDGGVQTVPIANLRVRAGSNQWASGGEVRTVVSRVIHSAWNPQTYENDIAILRLSSPFTVGERVRPIGPDQSTLWTAGRLSTVTGWGHTTFLGNSSSNLREAVVPIVADSTCGSPSSYGSEFFAAKMVCAGFTFGGVDSCQGDSGGPLVVGGSGGPFQMGIVSWGTGCAFPDLYGVYTRLANYRGTVLANAPISDNFADGHLLTGTASVSATNLDATTEAGEPDHVGAGSASSIWFTCLATTTGTYSVNTAVANFDTSLAVYTGDALDALTPIAGNDDVSPVDATSAVSVDVVAGTIYHIAVSGVGGESGLVTLGRTLPCKLPSFKDVWRFHQFWSDIEWMSTQGISTGYSGGIYRPGDPVSRQAMSAFLFRLAGQPPGPYDPISFPDVLVSNQFYDEIAWMVTEGLTSGYLDGSFHPLDPVSRQAMASFLWKLAGEPGGPFPDPGFTDVTGASPFYTAISWMADTGITGGYADGGFHPGDAVTRQSMSVFLHRYDDVVP